MKDVDAKMLNILPPDLILVVLQNLGDADLARCAHVCRKLYNMVLPILYKTVYFRPPPRLQVMDPLIQKLEKFTEPTFTYLQYTTRVIVVGAWYQEYTQLEADAGLETILSPAVRMFSMLIDVCLAKMPKLTIFIWDAEIPPTKRLMSGLRSSLSLKELQLRLGIEDTPLPPFYSVPNLSMFNKIETIKLNQINSREVLETIGSLLSSTRLLKHLYIEVDPDSNLNFHSAFAQFPRDSQIPLRTLHAVGFSDFQGLNASFWNIFFPNTLSDLNLIAGTGLTREFVEDFWVTPLSFYHCIRSLSTNLIDRSLVEFIGTCVSLDTLILHSSSDFESNFDYTTLTTNLRRSGRSIRCLGMYPWSEKDDQFLLTGGAVQVIKMQYPNLDEIAFGLISDDFSIVDDLLSLKDLRILHIQPLFLDSEYHGDSILTLLSTATQTANNRPALRTLRRRSQRTQRSRSEPRSSTNADEASPKVLSRSEITMKRLEHGILEQLQIGHAPSLRIVAFSHNTAYEVKRNPLRLEKIQVLVSSLTSTQLFRTPFLEWAA